jgi:hypothetical protein
MLTTESRSSTCSEFEEPFLRALPVRCGARAGIRLRGAKQKRRDERQLRIDEEERCLKVL